ncbi:hypothetical protein [Pseudoxanthomonas sp. CF125]|uniref:hypothetical protein n=1 Tax=Pseudoxanthomonas sp. CF125 TaxID=1855303 RepID=UPI00088004C0|nr:hypothetical protein [Pseudoxanthomonas sp. CF125]SDQ84216.1 hypothetical protein SAMN05216569_2266 [Pseudoxanthomonas sp. CF125]
MTLPRSLISAGFFSWLDSALSQPIPARTEAFHFNLYEGADSVHVQLVGTEAFLPGANPSTDYWPSAETFSTGEDIFEVPFTVAGPDWRAWLKTLIDLVNSYIADGSKSGILRSRMGVGIGFVDGDMHVLWHRDAA